MTKSEKPKYRPGMKVKVSSNKKEIEKEFIGKIGAVQDYSLIPIVVFELDRFKDSELINIQEHIKNGIVRKAFLESELKRSR